MTAKKKKTPTGKPNIRIDERPLKALVNRYLLIDVFAYAVDNMSAEAKLESLKKTLELAGELGIKKEVIAEVARVNDYRRRSGYVP